jgi:uncharacterized membrane protein
VEFGFSFLIIVGVWLGYSRIVSVLPAETFDIVFLNLFLLFCVALEPFLYYVLFQASAAFADFASGAYAVDTGAMMGLLSCMMFLVVRQERRGEGRKLDPTSFARFRVSMVTQAVCAALFLLSATPIFWVQAPGVGYVRFLMWYVALGIFFASRGFGRKKVASGPAP